MKTTTNQLPRIAPVPEADRVGEVRERLNAILPRGVEFSAATPDRNLPCTLVKHPDFFMPWAMLGGQFRRGVLPEHDRELVTLRVAHLTGSPYEWAHHTRSARLAGIPEAEIEAVRVGTQPDAWSSTTAAAVRAVDDVFARHAISDEVWAELAEEYSEQQLIELLLLIGFYAMTAWVLNSVHIEIDGWLDESSGGAE